MSNDTLNESLESRESKDDFLKTFRGFFIHVIDNLLSRVFSNKGIFLDVKSFSFVHCVYMLASIPETRHYGYRRVHTRNDEYRRPYPKKKLTSN